MDNPGWGPYHSVQLEERYQELLALRDDTMWVLSDGLFDDRFMQILTDTKEFAERNPNVNANYTGIMQYLEKVYRSALDNDDAEIEFGLLEPAEKFVTDLFDARTKQDMEIAVLTFQQAINEPGDPLDYEEDDDIHMSEENIGIKQRTERDIMESRQPTRLDFGDSESDEEGTDKPEPMEL